MLVNWLLINSQSSRPQKISGYPPHCMAIATSAAIVDFPIRGTLAITTTRVITYTYDPLNRLTKATYSSGESYEYAHDVVGNRTALTATTSL